MPRTSRNASSIDSPSTSGVASRTPRTSPCWPRCTPPSEGRRRSRGGRVDARASRPSPFGCRTPWPRSSPRARRLPRRSQDDPGGVRRPAARPTRRTSRRRRAGWSPPYEHMFARRHGGRQVSRRGSARRRQPRSRVARRGGNATGVSRRSRCGIGKTLLITGFFP